MSLQVSSLSQIRLKLKISSASGTLSLARISYSYLCKRGCILRQDTRLETLQASIPDKAIHPAYLVQCEGQNV